MANRVGRSDGFEWLCTPSSREALGDRVHSGKLTGLVYQSSSEVNLIDGFVDVTKTRHKAFCWIEQSDAFREQVVDTTFAVTLLQHTYVELRIKNTHSYIPPTIFTRCKLQAFAYSKLSYSTVGMKD